MRNQDVEVIIGHSGMGTGLHAASLYTPKSVSKDGNTIEISVRGRWVRAPALEINRQIFVITGSWIKSATVHDEEWLETELINPEACVNQLREQGSELRPDLFSFTQKVSATVPRHTFPMEWDSLAAIRITTWQNWWEQLPRETRKNVRRSEKRGVKIACEDFSDELVGEILQIQNECSVRQGRLYQHYGKSFDQVKRDHSGFAERSDFICARFENELIGFLKLVDRGDVASIMQLNSQVAHYDKRPANALLAKAVEICETKGISYLTYGRFNYGNKDDSGLRDFKIRNGFENVLVPRYYVPLTPWGKICVKARLYRGLHQILPSSVIKAGVNIRAKWYSFRAIERTTLVESTQDAKRNSSGLPRSGRQTCNISNRWSASNLTSQKSPTQPVGSK